jgi:hypothetical protein
MSNWARRPSPTPESFSQQFESGLIITTSDHVEDLRNRLPVEYTIIKTAPYFLREEQLVLLAKRQRMRTAENVYPSHVDE